MYLRVCVDRDGIKSIRVFDLVRVKHLGLSKQMFDLTNFLINSQTLRIRNERRKECGGGM